MGESQTVSRPAVQIEASARQQKSLVWPAALIGLFVLSVYLFTGSSDLKHNGDTALRYQTTQAIVDHLRLWIVQPVAQGTRIAVGLGGHQYVSAYGPGQTIFMIPFYLAGKGLAHAFALSTDIATQYASRSLDLFLGAALAVVFFLVASSMGYRRRSAIILTLLFALTSPAWPDAQSALEHTQVSLFLLLSVFALWRFVQGGMAGRRWLLLAGTASGIDLFTRYDSVIFIPLLILYGVALRMRQGERKEIVVDWLTYGLAVLPWIGLLMLWNQLRFGSPFNVALHLKTFGEPPWVGLPGLLVSPGKGIIWYLPLVFLLPWAVPRFYRRNPPLTLLFGGLVLVAVGFYSFVLYWHGDPAWGPRYLYPILPYLVLPLGEIIDRWRKEAPALKVAAIALIILSLAIQVAAISVVQWRFWYHLEAAQEHTAHKFNWGPTAYFYYWNVSQSPILIQFQDVYQVIDLDVFGDRSQRLTRRPTACIGPTRCLGNPADNYPLNTLAFWWADTRHPLVSAQIRAAIALLLVALAAGSGTLLGRMSAAERECQTPDETEGGGCL
jgi:hypothetical protein